jgi:DNA-binding HxlR family transcriptional regulator
LIVRELTLRGACRRTDLRSGLPGIATNLLAERLRELERAGVVTREDAPPPVATVFRLTPRGEQLRPVLEARDGAISARLGAAGEGDRADATISGPPRSILGLLLGLLGLTDAEAGGVEFRGDRAILDRLGSELTATAG